MKNSTRIIIVVLLASIIGAVIFIKQGQKDETSLSDSTLRVDNNQSALPRLLDLGAGECIPCKMMAPILDELKKEYANQFEVVFVDVWENPEEAKAHNIRLIPTQIFFNPEGKELFRHEGFFAKEAILKKWTELGIHLGSATQGVSTFNRWEPVQPDNRVKETVCYLCDGDIDPKTQTIMKTAEGDVTFCSPHCYIITYASLTDENKTHDNVSVKDWSSDRLVPVSSAIYLYGMDENGRPTIRAFENRSGATEELGRTGGNLLTWPQLLDKETTTLCGFCDRPVYPEDASVIRVDGIHTWGCCPMCALGVAARTGKDIEVFVEDALTGETVRAKTYEGHVVELKPGSAVAWAGAKLDANGEIVSTGCFKQAFFMNEDNLRQWVDENPLKTGHMISIEQALAAKIKLTPEQISKACKIGECVPK